MITAIDAKSDDSQADSFRIKIWNADGVIYDYQRGYGEDSDASTALGGGSITVHK
jgi:hypothetical protein